MHTEKSPGSDRLLVEFYKTFKPVLSSMLMNSLNYSYKTGLVSITQQGDMIKLIPKRVVEPHYIRNWRSI